MREGPAGWRVVDVLADGAISQVAVQTVRFSPDNQAGWRSCQPRAWKPSRLVWRVEVRASGPHRLPNLVEHDPVAASACPGQCICHGVPARERENANKQGHASNSARSRG
jgi:hypothetical protein